MVVDAPHPTKGTIKMLGNPVKVVGREDGFRMSPRLGEHTQEILKEWLDLDDDKIEHLRKEKVI